MDGKLFLLDKATPPPMSQVAATAFSFDLQRFDGVDSISAADKSDSQAISQGYYIFAKKNASDTGGYFKSIKDASEKYIASNAANDNKVMGEIKLLADVNDAKGFKINPSETKARVTIDLNNHNLIFTEDLKADGVQVGKGKVMQILKAKSSDEDNDTYVEIKNGTIGVAGTTTDRFDRLIRSYADLKLTNVTLDGTNVKDQTKNADDALLCISAGDVTLDGTTNIITKGDGYYAIGGKLTDSLASPDTTTSAYNYGPGFSINISVNGDIPSVVLNEWMQESFSTSTFDRAHISIASGNIGRIALSELARSLGGANQISISGGTFGTFDYDTTADAENKFLVYGGTGASDSFSGGKFLTTYDGWKFGAKGWNAASASETNTEYNYVTATSSGNSIPGTMILNAKNVEDKSALVLDDDRKTFGVPTGATANLLSGSTGYKLAYLNYNSDKDAVTVSGATEGAVLAAKASSVASANDGILAFNVKTINASDVNVGASIFANSLDNEIYGGTGANVVSLGAGSDTYFYGGGADTIDDYTASRTSDKDVIRLTTNFDPVTNGESITTNANNDLVLNFGERDILTFKGVAASINSSTDSAASMKAAADEGEYEGLGVTLLSSDGKDAYIYRKGSVGLNASDSKKNGVTLTAGYSGSTYTPTNAYYTINGAAVSQAISIKGDNYNNYIIGGKQGGLLFGDSGNDTLVRGNGATTFQYAEGNDVIEGYTAADKVAIDSARIEDISGAKVSRNRLIFNIDKNNSLTFNPASNGVVEKVSLSSENGGFLTENGYVNASVNGGFKMFANAKGRIDLTDTLYDSASITSVDASAVENSVTLTGASIDSALKLGANKKKDLFEYGGGKVTITGFEGGTDRLDISTIGEVSRFTIKDKDVAISVAGTNPENNVISLRGGQDIEVLMHDGNSKGNSFSKFVFHDDGILLNKAKRATEETVSAGASSHTVGDSIKKVFLTSGVASINVTAGDNKTTLNAADAGEGISLTGSAKNIKFIASNNADMFIYTGGKDVVEDFDDANDQISFDRDLNNAKITLSRKSLKFKFDTKNTLTLKSNETLSGSASINGSDYTYAKNSIVDSSRVSLTSQFSGTYKIDDSKGIAVNYVDGHLVEKNLTFKGTSSAESLIGGQKKTTFKGGGGADSLVGGTGKDVFFYAKGDAGVSTIANFEFGKDKLKIANGTIHSIDSLTGGGVQFAMTNGKKGNETDIGWFNVKTDKDGNNIAGDKVFIKANSTYYWFANEDDNDNNVSAGDLITLDKRVSVSEVNKVTNYGVIDLGYSTNLFKSGVATAKVSSADYKFTADGPSKKQA